VHVLPRGDHRPDLHGRDTGEYLQ